MLKHILELLQIHKSYGVSECIQIAKGKNKLPETTKELKQYLIRLKNGDN